MDVESEIKNLKNEEQRDNRPAALCGPFCAADGKSGISICGLGFLLVGLYIFAGAWATYILPVILVVLGLYLLSQAKARRV